jgi:hypothetical protein
MEKGTLNGHLNAMQSFNYGHERMNIFLAIDGDDCGICMDRFGLPLSTNNNVHP